MKSHYDVTSNRKQMASGTRSSLNLTVRAITVKTKRKKQFLLLLGVARLIDASIYRDTFPAIRIAIFFFPTAIYFLFSYFFFPQLFSFRQKRFYPHNLLVYKHQ